MRSGAAAFSVMLFPSVATDMARATSTAMVCKQRGPEMRFHLAAIALVTMFLAAPADAALKTGAAAPEFSARASLGGKEFDFSLADALKKGPVVLYFYPAAFTRGCTLEAHLFAEAMDEFAAQGASVIGMSGDDIETLNRFSTSECRGKFPVASDADRKIMQAYDAVMPHRPEYANRISYVIAPDGRVILEHTSPDPHGHVEKTLEAVKKWKSGQAN